MSQSSTIYPEDSVLSVDTFIEIIKQDKLEAIKQYISQDNNKFIKMMESEAKPEKINLLQVAAQNGREEIVKFFIDNAMKSERGKQLLHNQLTRVDAYDRSIIHWVAQVNRDEVGPCLAAILEASHQLNIIGYVNLKENVFGSTPLMMAARQGAIANISVLLQHKADMNAKSKDDKTVLDLIKYADPKVSIPTMKYFIKNTEYANFAFIKIHGDDFAIKIKESKNSKDSVENKNVDRILSTLITIDLDAALSHDLAQLSALKTLVKSTLIAENESEAKLMLANHHQIDFVKALRGYKIQKKDSENELLSSIFDNAIKKTHEFKLSENNAAIFAQASLLLSFELPEAQKSAFLCFTVLMQDAPHLAFEGFEKINKKYLDDDNKFLLTKRKLITMANINLAELGPDEQQSLFEGFFEKENVIVLKQGRNEARQKLKTVICDITNADDMNSIVQTIEKIPSENINLQLFKNSALFETKENIEIIEKSSYKN